MHDAVLAAFQSNRSSVQGENRVAQPRGPRRARFSRAGVACTVSTGFSDEHSTVEFTSQNLVDGARLELAFHGCRPWVIPLYEPPIWGEMRESNSRDRSHNPVPKPFGQSRHRIWSWSSESNTRRRGTSSLHCHCARPANFWSWHAASNCGRALTVRLLFPLSYTSGAGAAIRTPIADLRGPRSSY